MAKEIEAKKINITTFQAQSLAKGMASLKVYCVGDPILEGIRVLSHAELEHWHYDALKNPQYRLENSRMEWESYQAPSIAQNRPPDEPQRARKPPEIPENDYHRLEAEVRHLQKELEGHLASSKPKKEKKTAYKGIGE